MGAPGQARVGEAEDYHPRNGAGATPDESARVIATSHAVTVKWLSSRRDGGDELGLARALAHSGRSAPHGSAETTAVIFTSDLHAFKRAPLLAKSGATKEVPTQRTRAVALLRPPRVSERRFRRPASALAQSEASAPHGCMAKGAIASCLSAENHDDCRRSELPARRRRMAIVGRDVEDRWFTWRRASKTDGSGCRSPSRTASVAPRPRHSISDRGR